MNKYRFNRTCSGEYGLARTGDVKELDDSLAESLLRRGLVTLVEPPKEPPKRGRPKGSKATSPELNK